eukprot:8449028-Pyramimonas_sp.AAC.2
MRRRREIVRWTGYKVDAKGYKVDVKSAAQAILNHGKRREIDGVSVDRISTRAAEYNRDDNRDCTMAHAGD